MDQYELVLEALRSLKPGEKPNISLVVRIYGVNQLNLSRCFHGITDSKEAQYNNQQLLSKEQLKVLI